MITANETEDDTNGRKQGPSTPIEVNEPEELVARIGGERLGSEKAEVSGDGQAVDGLRTSGKGGP